MKDMREKITRKRIQPDELRIFEKGKFVFAAFDEGGEMVVDLSSKPLGDVVVFLDKMFPLD